MDYWGGVLGQLLSRVLANFPFPKGISFVQLSHQMSCVSNVCVLKVPVGPLSSEEAPKLGVHCNSSLLVLLSIPRIVRTG
jgi:hypothetical protein